MAVPLRLKVYKGEQLVATKDFDRDMIKIGRLSTAHLCLEDEKASRIHSVLNVEGDGRLSLVDMGSVEGTYLNGKRINKGFVSYGDEIRIGGTRVVVEAGAAEAVAPAAPEASGAVTQIYGAGAEGATPPPSAPPVASPPAASAPVAVGMPAAHAPAAPAMSLPVASAPTPIVAPMAHAMASAPAGAVATAAAWQQPVAYEQPGEEPAGGWEGMEQEERFRVLKIHEKPFGTYVEHKPEVRRARAKADSLGLQIRYYWGDTLLQVTQHATPENVYVGSTARSAMRVSAEQIDAEEFTLVTGGGDGFSLNVGPGMVGELDRGGQPMPLKPGSYDLKAPDFAWVNLGSLRVELSFDPQPKRVVVPISQSIDYRFINLFLLLFFLVGAFVISASTHTEADVVADDLTSHKLNVVKFLIKEAERPKKNALLDKLEKMKEPDPQPGEQGEKHKGEEGKMGKKDLPANKVGRSAPKAIDINAKELVKQSGLLKTLGGGGGGGGLATIFGQGGLGGDIKGAIGNMFGPKVGDAGGFGGLGLKGTGTGGGGMGNTIGIGGIGTKGRGGGLGGYGLGVGSLGGKKSSDIGISDSDSVVQGSLDKELIRQVIRRNIGQIRFCYEQELQAKPNLAGKLAIRFVIAPNGDVASAKLAENSTLTDARLAECVTVRVHGWKFPAPKGGGSVIVTYPFLLKPAGD